VKALRLAGANALACFEVALAGHCEAVGRGNP
jgi:hypothetical protein